MSPKFYSENKKMNLLDWVILTGRMIEDWIEYDDDFKLDIELIYHHEIYVENKTFNIKDFIERNSFNKMILKNL